MKPYYYVWRVRIDHDFSARSIFRYATIEEARAEAEQLAEKYKGVSFQILKVVAISCVPKSSITYFMDEEPPCASSAYGCSDPESK